MEINQSRELIIFNCTNFKKRSHLASCHIYIYITRLLQILYLRAAKLHFCQETIVTFSTTVTTDNKNNEKIYSGINYTHKGGGLFHVYKKRYKRI